MKYKITLEYVGSGFSGWQRQENNLSVQQIIEDAIYQLTKEKTDVIGAGRTDKGVHAYAQVAHFEIKNPRECYKFKNSLNHFMRMHKILIIDCQEVTKNFHARFSAQKRHYLYKIFNRDVKSVFNQEFKYCINTPLSINKMQQAAKFFLGTHNFEGFRSSECQSKSAVKTIDNIEIIHHDMYNIHIYLTARSFLQRMVRKIVGTLIMVGKNQLVPDMVENLILSKDKGKTGPTAPAHGLYLLKVDYY